MNKIRYEKNYNHQIETNDHLLKTERKKEEKIKLIALLEHTFPNIFI